MSTETVKKGFTKGFGQICYKDLEEAKKDLWSALAIRNRTSWYSYLNGKTPIERYWQIQAVENVFHKYGIYKIWDNE